MSGVISTPSVSMQPKCPEVAEGDWNGAELCGSAMSASTSSINWSLTLPKVLVWMKSAPPWVSDAWMRYILNPEGIGRVSSPEV